MVVVSSKSGSTVETDSQRRAYVDAFTRAGLDPTRRIVIVTDPGSPLDQQSRADGYRVVNADPEVGGRFSALTAFGLVPSGLAGADIEALLDEADAVADLLAEDDEGNPALRLGAAMAGTDPLRDKLVDRRRGVRPGRVRRLGRAARRREHRQGRHRHPAGRRGRLRRPGGGAAAAGRHRRAPDRRRRRRADPTRRAGTSSGGSDVTLTGSLGAQLLLWEAATAVAGRLLGINPFDQPDVETAKKAARSMLEGASPTQTPALFTDGPVEVRSLGGAADDGAHPRPRPSTLSSAGSTPTGATSR